ncbi:IRK-interacting protein-like [Canna indica]|uniref:IRK-interacting protein-like n=1 Tax=Canna indica TaxID=4628 RepID=A0AAQ3KSY3_9LILI|nr:IRK-interacting protein-like [Canna indica]
MAASSAVSSQGQGKERSDIQAAVAKAVELRSLHTALLQRSNLGSPAVLGPHVGASPSLLRRSTPPSIAAEDYPVFTPSHEEPSRGYSLVHPENRSLSATWRSIKLGEGKNDEAGIVDRNRYFFPNSEQNICSRTEHISKQSSCINHSTFLPASLVADALNSSSSRTSPADYETISTYNTCKPATISRKSESEHKSLKSVSRFASLHDLEPSIHVQAKQRGPILSWLFPKSKKKCKSEMSSNPIESDKMSQFLKDWGLLPLESLKKELLSANKKRDAALAEASEMRSSLGELQQKLVNLETYCEELKKALKQATHARHSQVFDRPSLSKRTRSNGCIKDNLPVSHEEMVEGFLQMVSESRLSVKQFCKMLVHQIEETDRNLMTKLNLLLQQQQMASCDKYSKAMLYHVEALVNQSLFQDFENCVFQKNGSPKFLDQQQDRRENFSAFIALRNLSWNEVLRKGTKYYSEDFSKFCDQKMSCIVSLLTCSRMWPEQLLQCFFVAAKCIWLLHLLAFSFNPPLMILRVEDNRNFDPHFMEDVNFDKKGEQIPSQVRTMVMPGFYIQETVLKCRVLCRYLPTS